MRPASIEIYAGRRDYLGGNRHNLEQIHNPMGELDFLDSEKDV
jgi:hypothetical protein